MPQHRKLPGTVRSDGIGAELRLPSCGLLATQALPGDDTELTKDFVPRQGRRRHHSRREHRQPRRSKDAHLPPTPEEGAPFLGAGYRLVS
ncbi:hypothetical protein [Streptomyces sp. NPDC017958]|uniref:hypothetical protein n=1 Tax=Streptomyces sp. NPDC017958 TaxID=3365021 RepID=UPI003794F2C1